MDFSNDTAAMSSRGNLPAAYGFMTASSSQDNAKPQPLKANSPVQGHNPSRYGYFMGGEVPGVPGNKSINERIDYSNDTTALVTRGTLTQGFANVKSTSSPSHGYSSAAASASSASTISQRLDFANDTSTQTTVGNFSVSVSYRGNAAGNKDYGYWFGGHPGYSIIERIDYSNDSATASPKGPMSAARYGTAAVGTQSYGYVGGNGLVGTTVIDRLDYSNDTATAITRGNTGSSGGYKSAVGNASYGYFTGGYPVHSIVTRLDYSNDTDNASPKGPLTRVKLQTGGTGDRSFGYIAGGYPSPGGGYLSDIDRIDYSNDTATALSRANVEGRRRIGAASATENANP
jgi:hypothetical protein